MSDTVIKIENISKLYRLGEVGTGTLTHDLNRWWHKVRGRENPYLQVGEANDRAVKGNSDYVWALRDISFEVKRGEILGIIGRNGAGKSTLLKILSRVTTPTSGAIKVKGRIASLLEVGTGFHPNLTGRENIYLNGAILGMRRAEIERKFDEIVAFAEVDRYIDTPVKRYSSGMYVRLAFAVAAHLEPEILIVDEVLAVGDAAFQTKCLGKMGEVAKGGRTVLFVSHNMGAITRLCQRAVLLEGGLNVFDGPADETASQYLASGGAKLGGRYWQLSSAPGDDVAKLMGIRIKQQAESTDSIDIRLPVVLEMDFLNLKSQANLIFALSLFNEQGVHLFNAADFDKKDNLYEPGKYTARLTVPGNLFAEGLVRICAEVSTRAPVYQIHFLEYDVAAFQVIDTGSPGSVRAGWGRPIPGVVRPKIEWDVEQGQKLKSRVESSI